MEVIETAYQAPNINTYAERWVLSVKTECLERTILFGEDSLRRALREYGCHFHHERPHQGLDNTVIAPEQRPGSPTREIIETLRLGGLLRSYHRHVASRDLHGCAWGHDQARTASESPPGNRL